jgi:hypothetical protein
VSIPVPTRNKNDLAEPYRQSIVVPLIAQPSNTRATDEQSRLFRWTMRSVCKVCTHVGRASQIPKARRALMNVCAKIAHAHLSFGLLIPEFDVRENPDQDGLTMNRTVSHRIETRHRGCSIAFRMSVCGCEVLAMFGVVYVASSAAPSYAANDTIARDYGRTSR